MKIKAIALSIALLMLLSGCSANDEKKESTNKSKVNNQETIESEVTDESEAETEAEFVPDEELNEITIPQINWDNVKKDADIKDVLKISKETLGVTELTEDEIYDLFDGIVDSDFYSEDGLWYNKIALYTQDLLNYAYEVGYFFEQPEINVLDMQFISSEDIHLTMFVDTIEYETTDDLVNLFAEMKGYFGNPDAYLGTVMESDDTYYISVSEESDIDFSFIYSDKILITGQISATPVQDSEVYAEELGKMSNYFTSLELPDPTKYAME